MAHPSRRSAVAPFLAMNVLRAAGERQRTHGDALMLCIGQPSTPAPAPVREAATRAVQDAVLGYTEAAGVPVLREAIADHHTRQGVPTDPQDVVVTTGSSGGFTALFLAAFDPGDTVVLARPGYPAYRNTLQALGIRVVELACGPDERYQPTPAMLDELPEPPAGLIVASPANPTGTIIDPAELEALTRWCDEHGTLLVSDEIYHGISYGRPCVSARSFSDQAVVVGSVSKYFSMTGWRLGWLVVPPWLREPLDVLLSNLSICPPAPAQLAAVAAFEPASTAELDEHVRRYARSRELLVDGLPRLGIDTYAPPDGAFYAWCDVSHLTDDSLAWCAHVLAETGVAITPGVDFDPVDGHGFVRMSFAGDPADVTQALNRLEGLVTRNR